MKSASAVVAFAILVAAQVASAQSEEKEAPVAQCIASESPRSKHGGGAGKGPRKSGPAW